MKVIDVPNDPIIRECGEHGSTLTAEVPQLTITSAYDSSWR